MWAWWCSAINVKFGSIANALDWFKQDYLISITVINVNPRIIRLSKLLLDGKVCACRYRWIECRYSSFRIVQNVCTMLVWYQHLLLTMHLRPWPAPTRKTHPHRHPLQNALLNAARKRPQQQQQQTKLAVIHLQRHPWWKQKRNRRLQWWIQ